MIDLLDDKIMDVEVNENFIKYVYYLTSHEDFKFLYPNDLLLKYKNTSNILTQSELQELLEYFENVNSEITQSETIKDDPNLENITNELNKDITRVKQLMK